MKHTFLATHRAMTNIHNDYAIRNLHSTSEMFNQKINTQYKLE